jgi:hypothetical protein
MEMCHAGISLIEKIMVALILATRTAHPMCLFTSADKLHVHPSEPSFVNREALYGFC